MNSQLVRLSKMLNINDVINNNNYVAIIYDDGHSDCYRKHYTAQNAVDIVSKMRDNPFTSEDKNNCDYMNGVKNRTRMIDKKAHVNILNEEEFLLSLADCGIIILYIGGKMIMPSKTLTSHLINKLNHAIIDL